MIHSTFIASFPYQWYQHIFYCWWYTWMSILFLNGVKKKMFQFLGSNLLTPIPNGTTIINLLKLTDTGKLWWAAKFLFLGLKPMTKQSRMWLSWTWRRKDCHLEILGTRTLIDEKGEAQFQKFGLKWEEKQGTENNSKLKYWNLPQMAWQPHNCSKTGWSFHLLHDHAPSPHT